MFRRIELINFMSHQHTVLDLADGLSVLTGPNNCGKSAVVAALQIVCHNLPSNHVVRHKAKECVVEVTTAEGDIVRWSRKRTGSPKYHLNGKLFDRLGRGNVPEEVAEALRVPRLVSESREFDVHFGAQREPVFLLNQPGSAAADFFASSSDATRLIEMQGLHKQREQERKRERKKLAAELDETAEQASRLAPLDDVLPALDRAEATHAQLQEDQEQLSRMTRVIIDWERKIALEYRIAQQATALKPLLSPPQLTDDTRLTQLVHRLPETSAQFESLLCQQHSLKPLKAPPPAAPEPPLVDTITSMSRLESRMQQLAAEQRPLENVAPPPTYEDATTLEAVIRQMQVAAEAAQSISRSHATIQPLVAPPDINQQEVEQAVRLIAELTAGNARLKELESAAEQCDFQHRALQTEARQFLDANKTCPTCGGALGLDQLESGTGHRHEAS